MSKSGAKGLKLNKGAGVNAGTAKVVGYAGKRPNPPKFKLLKLNTPNVTIISLIYTRIYIKNF